MLRYRTETFSGEGFRDAAEVMAFETFELGNTDIPEYLCSHQLKGSSLAPALESITKELDDNGFVDDMSWDEKVNFFREVLGDLSKVTGVNITHALWLADPNTVLNFYGKDLTPDSYIDAYEPGPVILTDLGHDGALYGYDHDPYPAREIPFHEFTQLVKLENERKTQGGANMKYKGLYIASIPDVVGGGPGYHCNVFADRNMTCKLGSFDIHSSDLAQNSDPRHWVRKNVDDMLTTELTDGHYDESFRYQMLDRLRSDCNYYLGYGNRSANALWARGDEAGQILHMVALYQSFPDDKKPEWLTADDIESFAVQMLGKRPTLDQQMQSATERTQPDKAENVSPEMSR